MACVTAPRRWQHLGSFVSAGLTVGFLAVAVVLLFDYAGTPAGQRLLAADVVKGYLPGAQRFLDTGSPYLAEQVAGPWTLDYHSFIHPPVALFLFTPFLVLPLALWWILPIGLTLAAIVRLRPSAWAWPLMAACLLWPRSTGSLLAGNTDIWAMTAVATGAAWGWPVVLLAIKPTFAPLGLVAIRARSTWIAAAVLAVISLPMIPLWLDWLAVITNAHLSWTYSLLNLPLVCIGAIAYLGRRRHATPRPDASRDPLDGAP